MEEENMYICKCGKAFHTAKQLGSHKNTCKEFQKQKQLDNAQLIEQREAKRLSNGMFICENLDCKKEHDGSYGSGKYCSKECLYHVRSLNSAKSAKKNGTHKCNFHANQENNGRFKYGTWKCPYCNLILNTKRERQKHIHDNHVKKDPITGKSIPWNKGLTIETDDRVRIGNIHLKDGYKSGRIKPSFLGRHLTKEHKDKIINTYIENRTNNKYRGTYKGIYFQYSFELAWIVWNLEHGIKISRCEETFQYWDSELKKNELIIQILFQKMELLLK